MDRSLMSFGKSADGSPAVFLRARDARQALLSELLQQNQRTMVFLSLNIPGPEKMPPGADALFESMRSELSVVFPGFTKAEQGRDALGPFLLGALDLDPADVKRKCITLETTTVAGRLIDLDVYSAQGEQVDRQAQGQPARTCLVCDQPAVECVRNKRHAFNEIFGKVNELLAPFVA